MALGLCVPVAAASPASAHAALVRTTPAQGSVLGTAPTLVALSFSEPIRLVPGKTQVIGPDGARINAGDPTVAGTVLNVPFRAAAHPLGSYLVSYRVISADGHPVAGGFVFAIGAPSQTAPPQAKPAGTTVVDAAIRIAKFIGYAGLVLLVGPVLVLTMLWPRRLRRRAATRLAWIGAGLVGLSTLSALWLEAPYSSGVAIFDVSGSQVRAVLASQFGVVLLARLAVLVAVAAMLTRVTAGRGGRPRRYLASVLGALGLLTWPLAGHPGASPVPAVTVIAGTVHVAAMAVWLGGLVMLVGFLFRHATERELRVILPAWSRWATLAVTWLVLAGLVQALVEVGTPPALVDTGYGQLVMAKVALLSAVLAAAAYARRAVRRHADGQPGRIRWAVGTEVAGAAVILAISAVLVQTTPAHTAIAQAAQARAAQNGAAQNGLAQPGVAQTLNSPLYTLQFDVYPARLGDDNTLHAYAYSPGGKPLPVLEWKVTAALPTRGVEPVDAPVLGVGENHAIGEVHFPLPGDWQLRFTLRVSDIDEASVTATIPVR